MEEFQKVYNESLDKDILVYKELLENDAVELSAHIINGSQYYFLQGNIDEAEFSRIVQGIKYRD